jgi:transposase-like protein
MTCHNCRIECQKHGKDRKGNQRFKCQHCSKTFQEPRERPLDNMYLPMAKAEMILKMLCEGVSVRSIERLTEVHRDTILRLLVKAGERCEKLLGEKIRNVKFRMCNSTKSGDSVLKSRRRFSPAISPSESVTKKLRTYSLKGYA